MKNLENLENGKKYEFIVFREDDGTKTYKALPTGSFETMCVHNTYDNGQTVSPEDAGDCLSLNSSKAVRLANRIRKEEHESSPKFVVGDIITAFDFPEIYEQIVYGKNTLKVGVDFENEYQMCQAYNYHDGSNWKSIVVSYDFHHWDISELVDDEDLISELNQAIEDRILESDGFGYKNYSSEKYRVAQSQFANNPFSWELTEK